MPDQTPLRPVEGHWYSIDGHTVRYQGLDRPYKDGPFTFDVWVEPDGNLRRNGSDWTHLAFRAGGIIEVDGPNDHRPRTWPQPNNGVVGVDRSDDLLLSLDEQVALQREHLATVTSHLFDACLVGNPAPRVQAMYLRLTHPQLGDYIIETSWRRHQPDWWRAFGVLTAVRIEWESTDTEWDTHKAIDGVGLADSDRRTDTAWYIQYGPDPTDLCRWTNCTFHVVPVSARQFRDPVGNMAADGTTFTRGALVDSGFELHTPR